METKNYYRIKTEWISEKEDKSLVKTKTEELVLATSYTEAEKIAYALVERYDRTHYGEVNIEIIKTKISTLLWTEIFNTDDVLVGGLIVNYFSEEDTTGVGLYQVKVLLFELDPITGKEKRSNETIFIPASSNTEAAALATAYLKKVGETRDFVVRDSKFDKAEAVLWSPEVHESKTNKEV